MTPRIVVTVNGVEVPNDVQAIELAQREAMVVSRYQARAALMQAGLLQAAEAAVAAADDQLQLAWAEAVEWRRNSPAIAAIGAALALTPEQVDRLFAAAAEITA